MQSPHNSCEGSCQCGPSDACASLGAKGTPFFCYTPAPSSCFTLGEPCPSTHWALQSRHRRSLEFSICYFQLAFVLLLSCICQPGAEHEHNSHADPPSPIIINQTGQPAPPMQPIVPVPMPAAPQSSANTGPGPYLAPGPAPGMPAPFTPVPPPGGTLPACLACPGNTVLPRS